MRILYIEDDETLSQHMKLALQKEGFAVDLARDAKTGVSLTTENYYDVILLDIMMPGLDGFWALKTLRQAGNTSIIFMISGQSSEEDKIEAFRSGADDYLVKPFIYGELVARIHVRLRPRTQDITVLEIGTVKLDLLKHKLTVNGTFIPATPKERSLFEYLLRHKGRVVTQQALLQALWSMEYDNSTNVVEVHVTNLRKKLKTAGAPDLIQTVRGSGYMIEEAA